MYEKNPETKPITSSAVPPVSALLHNPTPQVTLNLAEVSFVQTVQKGLILRIFCHIPFINSPRSILWKINNWTKFSELKNGLDKDFIDYAFIQDINHPSVKNTNEYRSTITLTCDNNQTISSQPLIVRVPQGDTKVNESAKPVSNFVKLQNKTQEFFERASRIFIKEPYGGDPEFWNTLDKMNKTFEELVNWVKDKKKTKRDVRGIKQKFLGSFKN